MKIIIHAGILVTLFLFGENAITQSATQGIWDQIKNKIEYTNSKVYSFDSVYSAGQTIPLLVGTQKTPGYKLQVFFIDDMPLANWAHPCRYVFVNTENMEYSIVNHQFPPQKLSQMAVLFGQKEIKKGQLFNFDNIEKAGKVKSATSVNDYAVIISGGNEIRFKNDCEAFYSALKSVYGYTDDRIFVLIGNGNDYGSVDNDYAATLANISTVFTQLGSTLTSADRLVVFGMEHGGQNTDNNVFMCLYNDELLPDFTLAEEMNKVNAGSVFVVLGPCYSGGFMDNLSRENRVIATACKADESSYSTEDLLYDEFNYHFISAIACITPAGNAVNGDENGDGFVSLREAVYFAKAYDVASETPLYNSRPASLGKTATLNGNSATTKLPTPVITNIDFIYQGDRNLCNPFKVSPELFRFTWNASHGSPKVHKDYNLCYMEAKAATTKLEDQTGEGVFIGYKLYGGHTYSIQLTGDNKYEGALPSGYSNLVFLTARGANGLKPVTYSDCDLEKVPKTTSSKIIYDGFAPDGVLPNGLANVNSPNVYLNADEKYDHLWVYPYQRSTFPYIGAVYLSGIAVTDHGVTVPESEDAKVFPAVTSNIICCNQEVPAAGGTPYKLMGTDITGPFQWSTSNDNVNWSVIPGETNKDYQPGSIVPPKYYKRAVTGGSESNVITISAKTAPTVFCSPGQQFDCIPAVWNTSHGNPDHNPKQEIPAIALSMNMQQMPFNKRRVSDGIYTHYAFKKGKEYIVSFYLKNRFGGCNGRLLLKACDGLHINPGDDVVTRAYADKEQLICEPVGQFFEWTQLSVRYVPNDDYDILWIYPHQDWDCDYTGSFVVGKVAIQVNQNIIDNTTYTQVTNYEFGNIISTIGNVIINSGIQAYFVAEEKIMLNPGFKANSGSYFNAKTGDIYLKCSGENIIIYNSSDLLLSDPDTSKQSLVLINKKTNELILYPNPTKGEFTIHSLGSDILNIEVIDLSGNIVLRKDQINQKSITINIGYLLTAIYCIKVTTK